MGFNMLKGLQYIVSGMNAFSQLNYFSIDWFHLSQVKSTDCTKNLINWFHLNQTIYVVFSRVELQIWVFEHETLSSFSGKLSPKHSCNSWFEDLNWSWRHFGLWVARRTHVWLARDNHHQVWMFLCLWLVCLMWFQVCKYDSCRVCV